MKIAVVGSRDFKDAEFLEEKLEPYLPKIALLISGGAQGADKLAERWARKHKIPTEIFLPDHKRYKHAFHHRDRLIAERAEIVIAFWKNRSSGTKYTIHYARKIGRQVVVHSV